MNYDNYSEGIAVNHVAAILIFKNQNGDCSFIQVPFLDCIGLLATMSCAWLQVTVTCRICCRREVLFKSAISESNSMLSCNFSL